MRKRRIYLDTTVPSALLDERAPERQELTKDFWERAAEQYDLCISRVVLDEIARPPEGSLRKDLATLVGGIKVLDLTAEALELARTYVEKGVMPQKYIDDARHLAVASVHEVALLASWNYRHLVKLRTQHMVSALNAMLGYPNVEIVTPGHL